jgi:hypothetical protein
MADPASDRNVQNTGLSALRLVPPPARGERETWGGSAPAAIRLGACHQSFFRCMKVSSSPIREHAAGPGGASLNAVACAVVVHQTPHRIRIRIPGWERRDVCFAALQGKLEACPGVSHVRVNALVAGIVIHCTDGFHIASARHCFTGLDLVIAVSSAAIPGQQSRQITTCRPAAHRPAVSGRLAALAFDVAIAVWTRRLESLVIEWIFQAVAEVMLLRLCRYLTPSQKLQELRPLLAAAAG